MEPAIVSAKGWVAIPAELRRKYGLGPGARVRIVDYGGVLPIVPEHRDPVAEGAGMLHCGKSLTQRCSPSTVRRRLMSAEPVEPVAAALATGATVAGDPGLGSVAHRVGVEWLPTASAARAMAGRRLPYTRLTGARSPFAPARRRIGQRTDVHPWKPPCTTTTSS
jgi:bifunctional DNA-binding transcriptional regulator/antitoxin component of YhaV-PrlF toxin-antitoxin module